MTYKQAKHLLLVLLLTAVMPAAKAQDILSILPFHAAPDVTTADALTASFVLNSTSDDAVWGYQVDIMLPDGVQFDESLPSPFSLVTPRHPLVSATSATSHRIDYAHLATDWWRIIVTPDDDTRLDGSEGLLLNARFTTSPELEPGIYPIHVKRTVLGTSGYNCVEPMRSSSLVLVGGEALDTVSHIDLSKSVGLLPDFAVDSLNNALTDNLQLTLLDIRRADTLAAPISLGNSNALVVAKAGTAHTAADNTLAWTDGQTPVCHRLLLDEAGGRFEVPFQFRADSLIMQRAITKTKWNTLCLPFELSNNQIREIMGGRTQIGLFCGIEQDGMGNDQLMFAHLDTADQALLAHTPCLIRPARNVTDIDLADVMFNVPTTLETTVDDFTFLGTYDARMTIPAGYYFISNNLFYRSTGHSTTKPFRAIFRDDRPSSSEAKSLAFSFFEDFWGTPTSVDNLTPTFTTRQPAYNLQGQRVTNPQRGIYIIGGQKVYYQP
ncbi:MAG: hypothetical protein J5486_05305 [Bacteroidaceae bacterium]|nr:hypothetical protein [Bacteroidaceae bacterium]